MGVDLFFVLSGFLITNILLETRTTAHYFRNFLARRFLRIWPLYYLNLLLFLVLLPLFVGTLPAAIESMQEKQAWFWLYGANWLFAKEGGFGHTSGGYFWSLAVEEQFYLVWPFVVYRLSERTLLRTSLGLLAFSFGLRLFLAHQGINSNSLYVITFTHLDGLAVGSTLAVCLRNPRLAPVVRRLPPYVAAAAVLGLVAVRLADGDFFFWSPNMARFGYTLIVLLFGAVLVYALNSRSALVTRWLSSRFMTQSGKYSYALYVVHVPIASVVAAITARVLAPHAAALGTLGMFWIFAVLAFAASWVISVLSWHLFEKRLLALKRYFEYRAPSVAPAPIAQAVDQAPH
jgi:peptidoglycan/LPS O-acetylase OafA/YrhL